MDGLVPKQALGMIEKYRDDMMVYITSNLEKYENEGSITKFLYEMNLPYSIEGSSSSGDIPDSLWNKINLIQQKGGTSYIMGQVENLDKKYVQIADRLTEIMKTLKNEEEEDNNLRTQLGVKWTRAPSAQLNHQYKQIIIDFTSKILF